MWKWPGTSRAIFLGRAIVVNIYLDDTLVRKYIYTMNGKDIVKRLKEEGWEAAGSRGSHVKMKKGKARTTVPVHASKDLPTGTVKAIEKQTGVKLT